MNPDDTDAAHLLALAGELRVVMSRLLRRLREESHLGDFTWSQVKVLTRLEREGPATVTTLAKAEGVRPQSMGETLNTLKAAGLVEGAPDPTDGRQTVLSLTDSCRDMIRTNRATREDWLSRALEAKLSPGERKHVAASIELLARLADFDRKE